MGIKASPETIQELINQVNTIKSEIRSIESDIKSGLNGLDSGWSDSKASEFKQIMGDLVKLMTVPYEVLDSTTPKLKALKTNLEEYISIKF